MARRLEPSHLPQPDGLMRILRPVVLIFLLEVCDTRHSAKAEVLPSVEHCHDKGPNNRAENSHHPTSLRERVMRRFKSSGHAQRFLLSSESFHHTSEWVEHRQKAQLLQRSDEIEIRIMG